MKSTSSVHKESRLLLATCAIGYAGRVSALGFVLATVQSLFRVMAIQGLLYSTGVLGTRLDSSTSITSAIGHLKITIRLPKDVDSPRQCETCALLRYTQIKLEP